MSVPSWRAAYDDFQKEYAEHTAQKRQQEQKATDWVQRIKAVYEAPLLSGLLPIMPWQRKDYRAAKDNAERLMSEIVQLGVKNELSYREACVITAELREWLWRVRADISGTLWLASTAAYAASDLDVTQPDLRVQQREQALLKKATQAFTACVEQQPAVLAILETLLGQSQPLTLSEINQASGVSLTKQDMENMAQLSFFVSSGLQQALTDESEMGFVRTTEVESGALVHVGGTQWQASSQETVYSLTEYTHQFLREGIAGEVLAAKAQQASPCRYPKLRTLTTPAPIEEVAAILRKELLGAPDSVAESVSIEQYETARHRLVIVFNAQALASPGKKKPALRYAGHPVCLVKSPA